MLIVLHRLSALTHPEIVKLLDRKVIQAELFDEKNTVEILDPEDLAKRYCLCRNPETAKRENQNLPSALGLHPGWIEQDRRNQSEAEG